MKLMDLLCSANGSTSVVTSSSSTTTTPKISNHHYVPPCSSISQFPNIINPKPNYFFDKHRNSTSSSSSSQKKHNNNNKGTEPRRHSCVELSDLYRHDGSSRRYLLSDAPFLDWVSDQSNNQIPISIVPSSSSSNEINDEANKSTNHHMLIHTNNNHATASAPTLRSSSLPSQNQVVVLRVSLHCKACEGKVRKHISKMEGVRSFSIERETKKVTIMGDVTPLGVLASVSKVKTAQLWSSSSISNYPSHNLHAWST